MIEVGEKLFLGFSLLINYFWIHFELDTDFLVEMG